MVVVDVCCVGVVWVVVVIVVFFYGVCWIVSIDVDLVVFVDWFW